MIIMWWWACAGLMVNLVSLELQSNTLEGTLPAGLAALPALKLLDASGNRLSGALPADWSAARPLTLLMLASNALTGAARPSPALHHTPVPCPAEPFTGPVRSAPGCSRAAQLELSMRRVSWWRLIRPPPGQPGVAVGPGGAGPARQRAVGHAGGVWVRHAGQSPGPALQPALL